MARLLQHGTDLTELRTRLISCVVMTAMYISSAFAQDVQTDPLHRDIKDLRYTPANTSVSVMLNKQHEKHAPILLLRHTERVLRPPAFFCRVESRIEQRSHIPFRFRLGSYAYTGWLEGKVALIDRYR